MTARYFKLMLSVIWLIGGLLLLCANWMPGSVRFGANTNLLGVLALLMAAYNGVRWLAAAPPRRSRPDRQAPPPQVRSGPREVEYLPEFDFDRPAEARPDQ